MDPDQAAQHKAEARRDVKANHAKKMEAETMRTMKGKPITDGQAKRLCAQYGARVTSPMAVLYWTGRVLPTARLRDEGYRQCTSYEDTGSDPQGFEADMRALADYFEANAYRKPIEGWADIPLDDTVIPWSYGGYRQSASTDSLENTFCNTCFDTGGPGLLDPCPQCNKYGEDL